MKRLKNSILVFIRNCLILYCKLFKRPTVKNIVVDTVEEQVKIDYYNNIMDLNQKISNQKRLIVDLHDRKDFLLRTIIRLKTKVEQSEERDAMISLWENDLIEVDEAILEQQNILQQLILEYSTVKANGQST